MAEEIKKVEKTEEVTEKVAEKVETVEPEKKKKGPLFWIIMILVIILVLVLCCCGCGSLGVGSIFDTELFTETYCQGLIEQGMDLSDDPFGWCLDY